MLVKKKRENMRKIVTLGFWLKNLPLLEETNNVKHKMENMSKKEMDRIHHMTPSPERSKQRSLTYTGIAKAMAEQWG